MFNIFRIAADLTHLLSIYFLLTKIISHKNCMGVSLRSQILFCIVWVTRYIDLFSNFYSIYNTVLKVVYLATSFYTIYLISKRFRSTYDKVHDTFNMWYLIIPSIVLAFIFPEQYTLMEILWTFSIFLETVAILPQIFLLSVTGEIENLNSKYILCLGIYRALYIANWVFRYATEDSYWSPLVWVCGIVQTVLYADYFYYYIRSHISGTKFVLP
ncbi:ER lumen protein retaining receptor, putative [Entamoeba invadens IP1]|uniref:ER lumen protein retaining receptor, putative n=1 Tax=Entamoeba invadens IP1 TaxID=370355 RepID=L7FKK4_ENTIV|nr:ER lumen protein retaining receptor, putative [Entamoeba invadens IP1]ELP84829.1 ER lumen protein retaining receptor, putative [Entamoeba invadens IP1]|eukprot:XP_004184175.1 ER lumen protein retaining receptor, putative [Entamoeba invadens IP1]